VGLPAGVNYIQTNFAIQADSHNAFRRKAHQPAQGRRHLLSFLDVILSVFSQRDTCPGAKLWHPPDVSSLSGRAKFEPVSTPLQGGIRFFLHLKPAPPIVCLTVSPAHRQAQGGDTRFPRSA